MEDNNINTKNSIMKLWNELYLFQNTYEFRNMTIKDKRDFKRIEDKLFLLAKNYYSSDLL